MEAADWALWRDPPERYGLWKTAHERLGHWIADGTRDRILDEAMGSVSAAG